MAKTKPEKEGLMDWLNDPVILESAASSAFAAAGVGRIAYVRRHKVRDAFVVHAANGAQIAVQPDLRAANLSARDRGLDVVSVH